MHGMVMIENLIEETLSSTTRQQRELSEVRIL